MFSDPLVFEELSKSQFVNGNSVGDLKDALLYPPKYSIVRVNTFKYSTEDAASLVEQQLKKAYEKKKSIIPEVYPHAMLKDVLVIESVGKLNVVPCSGKEVIVGVQCAAAVLRGAEIYCPGIVGCPQSLRKGDAICVYADLTGKCLRGFADVFEGPKLFIGNGVALFSRTELFGPEPPPRGCGIMLEERIFDCPSLNDQELKDIGYLQNLPSVIVGHVLDPQPGETVLDMCAAPGGKTTHIASLMKNTGLVVALDKTNKKVDQIMENCRRFGITNVKGFAFDATKAFSPTGTVSEPPFPAGTFDRILLDAPCSALGQRPQLFNKMTYKELQTYPNLQRKLFATAVELLKKGGRLVYSTCTVTKAENEDIVSWALSRFPVRSIPMAEYHLPMRRFHMCKTKEVNCDTDTIGFFISCFEKT